MDTEAMARELKESEDLTATIWSSPDIAIWWQLGMWHDTKKKYLFAPAYSDGFVAVTKGDDAPGCVPLQGYRMFRPYSVSLAWPSYRSVKMKTVSRERMDAWYKKQREHFRSIGLEHGTAR